MKLTIEGVIRALGMKPVSDVGDWGKWWSTKLSLAASVLAAAALAYNEMPQAWRDSLPEWVGPVLGGATVVVAALIPIARAAVQPTLERRE